MNEAEMEKAKSVTVTIKIESEGGDSEMSEVLELPTVEVEPSVRAENQEPVIVRKSRTKPELAAIAQEAMNKLKQKFLQGLCAMLFVLLFAFPHISIAETFNNVEGDQWCIGGNRAEKVCFGVATASLSCAAAAATCTATNLIPAGATVLAVSTRVTTLFAGCTSIDIGDGTDADRWGNDEAITAGSTTTGTDYTAGGAIHYAAATSVVLTAVGGAGDFSAGVMRISVIYMTAGSAPNA